MFRFSPDCYIVQALAVFSFTVASPTSEVTSLPAMIDLPARVGRSWYCILKQLEMSIENVIGGRSYLFFIFSFSLSISRLIQTANG